VTLRLFLSVATRGCYDIIRGVVIENKMGDCLHLIIRKILTPVFETETVLRGYVIFFSSFFLEKKIIEER
jgi:hypothetical protein